MRAFDGDQPITNLTEAWWNKEKSDLLAWNGFYECGSDYDLLQKLITCVKRDPESAIADQIRGEWQALFGTALSFDTASCAQLWQYAARCFFQAPVTKKQVQNICQNASPIKREGEAYVAQNTRSATTVCVNELSFPQTSWKEWSAEAERYLCASVKNGVLPCLLLPVDFQVIKPSLYHVERILSGEESNRDLFLSQWMFFLLSFCEKKQIRPVLVAECAWETVLSLLKTLASLTDFPCLAIQSDCLPDRRTWSEICRTVLKKRGDVTEGVAPVLVVPAREPVKWLPRNLLLV